MAPLPLLKIFAVLLKEASKPLAAAIKRHAHDNVRFRSLSMALGRSYEQAAYRLELMFLSKGRVQAGSFKAVPDAHAFTVGTDLITQGFLLSTALSLVVVEYWRSQLVKDAETAEKAAVKAAKRAVKEARLKSLESSVAELQARLFLSELAAEDAAARRQQQGQGIR